MHSIKNKRILSTILVSFFAIFAVAFPVFAQSTMGWTATIFSSLAQIIIELVGKLLIVLIEILIAIVKYNDFINADAVQRGWILVRDISNMAFLIIFIAIAFATILGVEKYEWKRLLPKLLIMSVAINFSKTICGIIIDASQVIMMTFVNGFKDIAAGNLIRGFGLNDMLAIRDLGVDENITDNSIAAASVLAVVLLIIAAMTLGVIVLMFLIRIVYLWILIVLSPLAFMLAAAPGADAQFQKWFQQFIRYAFIGPILAFFLWLSFSVMAGVDPGSNLAQKNHIPFTDQPTGFMEPAGNTAAAISGISRSDNLLSYFIAIALLLLSLTVANSIGTAGSSLAGNAMAKIKSGGVKLGKLGALHLATGGGGAALGYLGGKGVKKFFGTSVGKASGRKIDDLVSPTILKGAGKIGSKILPGRLGQAATRLGKGEFGGKFRVIKQAWKDRSTQRESELTAEARGGMRDIFNKGIDNKDTDYASRERNKLVAEAKKSIQETTDMSTSTLKNIVKTGSLAEQKAALLLLQEKTSIGDVVMNEDTHKSAIKYVEQGTARLEARQKYLDGGGFEKEKEDMDKEILAIDSDESLTEEQKQEKKTEVEERKEKLIKEKESLPDQITNNQEYVAKMKKNKAMDSTLHRWIYMRDKFGDTASTAEFYSGLSSVGRKSGETQLHGSVKYDTDSKTYVPADFATPEGRQEQINSMAGRASYQDTSETMKADGMALRDKVKDENGNERYGEINESGRIVLQNMAGNTDSRTIKQMTPATFAAMLGGDVVAHRLELSKQTSQEGRDKLREEYGKSLWEGLDDVISQNILGESDINTIKGRLQSITGMSDKQGTSAPVTSQVQQSTQVQQSQPAQQSAEPVLDNQKTIENSIDNIDRRINVMQGQIEKGAPVADVSNSTADAIDKQFSSLMVAFNKLPQEEQKKMQSVVDAIQQLGSELRVAGQITDNDEREQRIKELHSQLVLNQNTFKSVLQELRKPESEKSDQNE